MPYYLQIDGGNVVVAVTQTAEPVDAPDMIEVETFDIDMLGQVYEAPPE